MRGMIEKDENVNAIFPNAIIWLYVYSTGFCPEYSTRAEGVQENFDIDCKKFQSSCPITFMSTEAYKCKHIHVDTMLEVIPTEIFMIYVIINWLLMKGQKAFKVKNFLHQFQGVFTWNKTHWYDITITVHQRNVVCIITK